MSKKIIYNEEARSKLKSGVDALAQAVGSTMGPLGRNVAIDKGYGAPNVTHDGVTVAKEVELKDEFENMGAKLVLQAATKTNDIAGDGTTTATVIAQALIESGLRITSTSANPMFIKRGLEKGLETVIQQLDEMKKEISSSQERNMVATISAQDEKIGEMISNAMDQVGTDGVITVEDGKGLEDELTLKEGMNFDQGYISPYFATDTDRMISEVNDVHILITDKKISTVNDLVPLLENLVKDVQSLVIIAEDVADQALATLVLNKLRGTLRVLAIKAPGFGDRRKAMLQDIATVTGGQVISEELGRKLESATLQDLGKASKVISTKDDTTIIGGVGSKESIEDRINQIKNEIENSTSDYDKEKLQERLAKLSGGVAIISVGAATESQLKEKKARYEDAVNATQAAVEDGIVPGGGIALLKARQSLKDIQMENKEEQFGIEILYEALENPFRKIITNAGLEPGKIIGQVESNLDSNTGFDVLKGKVVDMVSEGIIDPAKVTKSAIQNAVSVTISILTTDALIADEPNEKNDSSPSGMPPMGGMPGMM